MPITANTLYRDSFNFLRNQLASILLLVLLTTFITVVLNQVFTPNSELLKISSAMSGDFTSSSSLSLQELIQQMSTEQKLVILKATVVATFSALVGNALLIGGMLTLLNVVSQGQSISALRAIGVSVLLLPRLLLLLFICTLLFQFGLMLLIVPGMIVAIAVSLAPVIMTTESIGVFASIKASAKLAFAHIRLITPAVMLWLAAKLLLLSLASHLTTLAPMATLALGALSNLVSALLLIYLFRLYMLLRHK